MAIARAGMGLGSTFFAAQPNPEAAGIQKQPMERSATCPGANIRNKLFFRIGAKGIFEYHMILHLHLNNMKLFLSLFSLLLLAGCQKTKEKIQEDIVIKAMTDGQWRITSFTRAGVDKTAEYAAYLFQFRANNTVEAINNGTTEKTGTWQADAIARTISSAFANAADPLMRLNGTWKITNNGWTFVEANQTVNAEVLTLRLDK